MEITEITLNCTIDGVRVYKAHRADSIRRNCTGIVGYGPAAGYIAVRADGSYTPVCEDAFQAARAAR